MPVNPLDRLNSGADIVAAQPLDYHSILKEAIEHAERNSAHVRALVYERARFNLKREALFGTSSLGLPELLRHINELELAIARIEASSVDAQPSFVESGQPNLLEGRDSRAMQILSPQPLPPLLAMPGLPARQGAKRDGRWNLGRLQTLTRVEIAGLAVLALVLVGVTVVASARWHSPQLPASPATAEAPAAPAETPVAVPLPYPIPSSYGVYAVSDNKLVELEPLPMRIPDPRVALSPEITKASPVSLASNSPSFLIFRRDLVNNAPGKMLVRIVARVVRETKFVNGKAVVGQVDDAWRIRSNAIELKVSPVPGNTEMIRAHADDGVSLAAGRYILVLNNVGYDFVIDGPMTSLTHCLERFESANGPMFTECRSL